MKIENDVRPPFPGREISSVFKYRPWHFRPKSQTLGIFLIPILVFFESIIHVFTLLSLRRIMAKRKKNSNTLGPAVAFFSDNLDEVNGIANNLRQVIPHHRGQGRAAYLVGTAFHTRKNGVVENSYTILLPQIFSMEQLGYKDSELAIPAIGPLLRFLKRYPVDLVELQTPAVGAWVVMLCCKIAGIRVISHYRTDIMGYVRLLLKNPILTLYIRIWMWLFCQMTKPVVVPSQDFVNSLCADYGLNKKDLILLPRGIQTQRFSPELRAGNLWEQYVGINNNRVRFLFVGRVSREKALHFLAGVWKDFRNIRPQSEMLIVGAGPYLDELKQEFATCPEVYLIGQKDLDSLAHLYAQADWLVFPSGTDTFGNVIVESLCTGTPALVSDRGGPRDIVQGIDCARILPFENHSAWLQAMEQAFDMTSNSPAEYEQMRIRCYERSREYTLEAACTKQWRFYESLCGISAKP